MYTNLPNFIINNLKIYFILLLTFIESYFHFRQYAAIVFITNNRFETGKKKLNYLKLSDFLHCADQMIQNWSYSAIGKLFGLYPNMIKAIDIITILQLQ